jgi:transcriptional regulator with XRE-family HTH domain
MKSYELAEKLGISKSYLSEIEKGKRAPTLELIQQYAAIFNTTPSAILLLGEKFEGKNKETVVQSINRKMLGFLKELANENEQELFD